MPFTNPAPLLPEILRQNGYRTELIGKLHFFPQQPDYGFHHRELEEEAMPEDLSAYGAFLAAQQPPAKRAGASTSWSGIPEVGVCNMAEELEETRWVADRADDFLQGAGKNPFFLFASFIRPHSPYNPLARYLDLYNNARIDPPMFDQSEWDNLPPRVREHARITGWGRLTPDDFVEIRRHYYALCTMVDENVGRILDSIDRAGLAEETIVVFTSDHGDFLGEHGQLHKMYLWDGSLHVPLIVRDPRRPAGLRYPGLVESIDVMPTLLDLVGIAAPPECQGASFSNALVDPGATHKQAVFAEYAHHSVFKGATKLYDACEDLNSISARTERYKYIHSPSEAGELYDIVADPGERVNLYHDPAMADVRQDLMMQLLDWRTGMRSFGYQQPDPSNPYFRQYFKELGQAIS